MIRKRGSTIPGPCRTQSGLTTRILHHRGFSEYVSIQSPVVVVVPEFSGWRQRFRRPTEPVRPSVGERWIPPISPPHLSPSHTKLHGISSYLVLRRRGGREVEWFTLRCRTLLPDPKPPPFLSSTRLSINTTAPIHRADNERAMHTTCAAHTALTDCTRLVNKVGFGEVHVDRARTYHAPIPHPICRGFGCPQGQVAPPCIWCCTLKGGTGQDR